MSHPYAADVLDFLHSAPRFQPDAERRLVVDDESVGWIGDEAATALAEMAKARATLQAEALFLRIGNDHESRSAQLQDWVRELHQLGILQNWRDEPMTLALRGQPFLTIERAAFRTLGLRTRSVHMNGWLITPEGMQLWVAERSHHKFVDPGKLDNLVGGGVAAGESLAEALSREAWEEAGLILDRVPRPSRYLNILRRIPEGLQDEHIAVYDCFLPAHFSALNQDGEVAHAGLMPLDDVLPMLLGYRFTWDASLVILAGLLRQRHFGLSDGQRIEQTLIELGYQ